MYERVDELCIDQLASYFLQALLHTVLETCAGFVFLSSGFVADGDIDVVGSAFHDALVLFSL